MRECPQWFQDELTRIGGRNQYGEPVFRLVWSEDEHRVTGGRFQKDGYIGYREIPAVPGEPCWALMVWEPAELSGSYERWEMDFRDPETGLLDCGGYPKYGSYRCLQRFLHREIVRHHKFDYVMQGKELRMVPGSSTEQVVYRMEPCGLMLDLMVPMLMRWLQLTDQAKVEAIRQEEQRHHDEFTKKAKDVRHGCKISRGSQLVQKRAEIIERGFKQAMAMAARTGLGMRLEN